MLNLNYKSYDDLPLMLTVVDVAKILGISRTGGYELAQREDFPSLKIGKRIVVPKEAFIQWVEKRAAGEPGQEKR